jgi:hypothetical protein
VLYDNLGPDGVLQIHPTIEGGTEFYMVIDTDNGEFEDTKI